MPGLRRLYHTLRPLRWQQWWYRAWHPVARRLAWPPASLPPRSVLAPRGAMFDWPVRRCYDPATATFVFLNRAHSFRDHIDWFFAGEGLLWQFNLQYFEWLYDEQLPAGARLATIEAFCRDTSPGRAMHPYPASLRIVAWVWFGLRHGGLSTGAIERLHHDADWLRRFPEYQLDGNHLFENALALIAAGVYLGDARILGEGARIFNDCVRRQLCADGGHCEGSPMYHSLLLWRLLQCVDVLRADGGSKDLLRSAEAAASRMLGWLRAVTFSDGRWPAVNDAVEGVAPRPETLFRAAAALCIPVHETDLSDSGYRMIREAGYELFIDVCGIAPAWQPGHAHADTGSFCLQVRGVPVIVDTGCSTYGDPAIRRYQRSTGAHNTPVVDGRDSSETWSRFRVGRRCRVIELTESAGVLQITFITAAGIELSREFRYDPAGITIQDRFPRGCQVVFPIHLHPSLGYSDGVIDGGIHLITSGIKVIEAEQHSISGDFNILLPAARLLLRSAEEIDTYHIHLRI